MSLNTNFKKLAAGAAGLATLLGPTIAIDTQEQYSAQELQDESTTQDAIHLPSVHLKRNTAKAGDHNLEGRMAVLGFDILFNGLKAGIGAKVAGDDFWPAFGKGAFSGVIVYGGKELASWNGTIPGAGASGKLIHDLGVSMSDNVTFGRPILSRYVTDIGPIEINFDSKDGVSAYLYPYSLYAIIKNAADGHRFEVKHSLLNLTPIFSFDKSNSKYGGWTNQNVFTYCRNCDGLDNIARSHEMVHVLHISEFRFIDEAMPLKSEIFHNAPILHKFSNLLDYIKVGPFIGERIMALPMLFGEEGYWYNPLELEAYTLNRPTQPNAHPFYK